MNTDYMAWNGERYVWPPPEGWYLASDGRWWAADTGPDMDLEALTETETATGGGDAVDVPASTPGPADHQPSTDPPLTDFPSNDHLAGMVPPGSQPANDNGIPASPMARQLSEPLLMADSAATTPAALTATVGGAGSEVGGDVGNTTLVMTEQINMAPPPPVAPNPAEAALDGPPSSPPPPILEATGPPPAPAKRSRTMTMVAAGCLVAAALVIAALLALLGGDNDVQTQQPSASADGEESDGLVVSTDDSGTPSSNADAMGGDGDSMMDESMTDGSMMDESMTDDSMTDDSMMDGSSTTTGPDSSSTSTGVLSEEDAAVIGQFRTLLEDNEITAAELTGDDILAFGETACSYTTEATDLAQYEQIRNTALAEAQNEELTAADLQFVVDSAVTVFCAAEAERLGLTLVPPAAPEEG